MTKRILLTALGYLFSVLPPALAVLERFPLWAREGGLPILSGLSLLLLLIAAIPLRRGLAAAMSRFLSSPSAFGVWGGIWLVTAWFGQIAVAISEIALIGTLSSLIGAVFFRLAKRGGAQDES